MHPSPDPPPPPQHPTPTPHLAPPQISSRLGDYPILWTGDFILDASPDDGADLYRLGELNASCVGFTTHLELAGAVADAIISVVHSAKRKAAAAAVLVAPGAPPAGHPHAPPRALAMA
jgi:hypothetical protein